MKDKDNNPLVIKSNRLIQDFKNDLSKTEIRIINMIISNIESPLYDEQFNMMTFHITDFYKMLGWNEVGGGDYSRLKNLLRNLSNKSSNYIQIGEKETIVRWIEKPYFHKRTGTVELKLDDDLKPFLLQVSGYIKANLKYYFEMDSKYSIKIYELLKSWEGCKKKEFEIYDFRSKIDAEQKSYENFGKFHQGVLRPSIEEINKVTDLQIDYETIAAGRKITHIIFHINHKKDLINKKEEPKTTNENPQNNQSPNNNADDKRFNYLYGIIAETFPQYTKKQIEALYFASLKPANVLASGLNMEEKQYEIIGYILPKLVKIKATPEETKSTEFYRLLDAVTNNY